MYKSSHQDLESEPEPSSITFKLESDHFSEESEEERSIEEDLVPLPVDWDSSNPEDTVLSIMIGDLFHFPFGRARILNHCCILFPTEKLELTLSSAKSIGSETEGTRCSFGTSNSLKTFTARLDLVLHIMLIGLDDEET